MFGWSYPAGCTGTPYDEDPPCEVCGKEPDHDCECPECECGMVGDPDCYETCGLKPAEDSVQAFCNFVGITPVASALRAIDKYNTYHVFLVMADGDTIYYHSGRRLKLRSWERISKVGVAGIAWDGSDWEWSTEVPAGGDWFVEAVEEFNKALAEHYEAVEEHP